MLDTLGSRTLLRVDALETALVELSFIDDGKVMGSILTLQSGGFPAI